MSGGEIYCGSFSGEDKSASAFEGVLKDMARLRLAPDTVGQLQALLDSGEEMHIEIPAPLAEELFPALLEYRQALVADIGHNDWMREAESEDDAGMDGIEAKWGASRGWRLYCATDLVRACEVSTAENEPIYLSFS